jgi:hypothetical protein
MSPPISLDGASFPAIARILYPEITPSAGIPVSPELVGSFRVLYQLNPIRPPGGTPRHRFPPVPDRPLETRSRFTSRRLSYYSLPSNSRPRPSVRRGNYYLRDPGSNLPRDGKTDRAAPRARKKKKIFRTSPVSRNREFYRNR